MWDLILPSSDKRVCQYDSAGRLGLIVLLFVTILTTRWRTSHAVWLCRKVEDFANLGTRALKDVRKLVRNPSYKNVDCERGSAECKSAAVSTAGLFGGKSRSDVLLVNDINHIVVDFKVNSALLSSRGE